MKPTTNQATSKVSQSVYQQGNYYCVYQQDLIPDFTPDIFLGEYWQQQDKITGTAQGRGTTYFIQHNQHAWVLRHYYRGGFIGKLINDSYWFTGFKQTRAAKEFALLTYMQGLNLPAPKPVAYQVIKNGLCYRANIITDRIKDAKDLVEILQTQALSEQQWQTIGATIKRFHQNGIYHHDLNSHNILIDKNNQTWLIDFDRGENRANNETWPAQNMARLLRSFRKEKAKLNTFYWQETNWQHLMSGYENPIKYAR